MRIISMSRRGRPYVGGHKRIRDRTSTAPDRKALMATRNPGNFRSAIAWNSPFGPDARGEPHDRGADGTPFMAAQAGHRNTCVAHKRGREILSPLGLASCPRSYPPAFP